MKLNKINLVVQATVLLFAAACAKSAGPATSGSAPVTYAQVQGTGDGGGGKGVECVTSAGPTLEILDHYESSHIHHLTDAPLQGSFRDEVQLGVSRLEEVWNGHKSDPTDTKPGDLDTYIRKSFWDRVSAIPAGARIPLTNDATLPVLAPNCKVVQIAVFNSLGLQLDSDYWFRLDERNQAMLFFHENLYRVRRSYGAERSDETRGFISRLFSTQPPTSRYAGRPAKGYLSCYAGIRGKTPNYDFQIYREPGGKNSIITFSLLADATTLGRVSATVGHGDLIAMITSESNQFGYNLTAKSDTSEEEYIVNLTRSTAGRMFEIQVTTKGKALPASNVFCELK